MSRRTLLLLVAIPAVIFAGGIVALIAIRATATAIMSDLRVYEPAAFATALEASQACRIPLPPEATNIRVAGWSAGVAHEEYLRFEAPVAVCLKHAAILVPGAMLAPVPTDRFAADQRPPQSGIFRDLSWFDLAVAQNVVGAGGGSQCPQVWVDQNRGVLYFRIAD